MNKLSRFLAAVLFALATPSLAVERASVPGEIVVDAGSTIQGVAGTGTAITYSIFGTEISSGNIETYKRLGSTGQLPTSTGTLYTAPATAPADVASITLTNTTGSDVTGVKIFIGGSAASNQLTGSITVPANGSCVVGDSGGAAKCFTPLGATLQTGGISGSGTSPDLAAFSASATIGNFSPPGPACSNQVQTNQTATGAPVCTTLTKAFLPSTTVSTDQANTYSTGAQDFSSATAVTLPNGTIVLGSLLDTAIVAPGTPTSGKASIYVDSTSKNIAAKNDLGTINHGVQTSAAVANQFLTGTADNGTVTRAQPTEADVASLTADLAAKFDKLNGQLTGVSGSTYAAGRLVYDTDNDSATFYNSDSNISLQVGQEHWIRVKNVTGSTITNGQAVYINGASAGLPTIALAQANLPTPSNAVGLTTESIANNGIGFVTALGVVHGLNTGSFTAGVPIYLSATTAGGLTATAPLAPNYRILVGYVAVSDASVGAIFVDATQQNTPSVLDLAADFGWIGDQQVVFDGACSTGANTKITSATAAFTQSSNYYLGKHITLATGGTSGAVEVGTISAIDSATQVTVTGATCATTASGKGLQFGTDNTAAAAALVSAVNAATYPGFKVNIPPSLTNRWATSSTMTFNHPVTLEGQGSGVNQDFGDYTRQGGSAIVWWGTSSDGGTPFQGFIKFAPITGASAQPIAAPALRHLWIECRNADQNPCFTALQLFDVVGMDITDIFIMDPISGLSGDTLEPIGGTASTGRGRIVNLGIRNLENAFPVTGAALATLTPTTVAAGSNNLVLTTSGQSIIVAAANGMVTPGYFVVNTSIGEPFFVYCTGGGGTTTLTVCSVNTNDAQNAPTLVTGANIVQATPNNGASVRLNGSTTSNVNLFDASLWRISCGSNWGMACIELANADSISFKQVVINGGNGTVDAQPQRVRHPGVRFNGSNTNAGLAARNNTFTDGDPGVGGVDSMALLNTLAKMTSPAGPNYWQGYQVANASPAPTIEVGSYLESWLNGGFMSPGLRSYDQTAVVAYTASTAKTIPGTSFLMAQQAIQVGTTFKWQFQLGKSAAGAAARLTNVRIGTTGTQTDANVCQFSTATSAIADTALVEVTYVVTVLNGASTTGTCSMTMVRAVGSTATGLFSTIGNLVQVGTPTAFTAPSGVLWYISLSLTTGASEVATTSLGKGYVERVATQAN